MPIRTDSAGAAARVRSVLVWASVPFRSAATLYTALLFLLLPQRLAAATYYVSPTGNDAAAGSQAAPWRTLQKAGDVAAAGDTVNVLPGTYVGFRARRSGTAQAPVRFVAQAGVVVNAPGAANSNGDNIWVRDVDYVVVDGFESTNAPRAGVAVQGEPDANATGVVVRNCHCHHNGRWGIFTGFARDLLLEDNQTSYSAIEHGIYVSNSGDRPTVRRNHAHHNNASGIQLNADPVQMGDDPNDPQGDGIIEQALIEANVIHDNGAAGGASINLASVRGSLIRNNLIYGNQSTGIAGWDDGEGSNLYGTRDNRIVGNTIVQPATARFAVSLKNGSTGNTFLNNILIHLGARGSIEADPSSQVGLVSDYNAVVNRFSDDDAFLTLAQWRALSPNFDPHSYVVTAATVFVDSAANDYHLSAGSPALNAGTTLPDLPVDLEGTTRPQGLGFDAGAYERAGAAPPSHTATATPAAPTPTPTAAVTYGISGVVAARSGAAVPSATLTLSGPGAQSTSSNASGAYAFAAVPAGVWQLTPRKTGDLRTGVSSLDAAWILQAIAGLRTLDARQRLAADVTGDGTLSTLDASLILQRAVGTASGFGAATLCGSDWLFIPTASAVPNQSLVSPGLVGGTCTMGSITYGPLSATATGQHFTAVLLGDVTGNWQ
ncbi:MAG: right-handed parallel beta-helix repeat-containing protein [Deltaproteobacteria bacterium]|nr:right-handed parallel beta-helix repeat-containing protein [Deltaproteobacteria bacterium]